MASSSIFRPEALEEIVRLVCNTICWVNVALIILITAQVAIRYLFNAVIIGLEELQWHLYATGAMVGMAYSQINDDHVRMEYFYGRMSPRAKCVVEFVGMIAFALPMCFVVFYHSLNFVYDSWRTSEGSFSGGGLQYRFIIKSVIPFSIVLLAIACISKLLRSYIVFIGTFDNE